MKAILILALCLPALADEIKHRQLIPPGANTIPTTSSSYDYWWPYPPGGVASTTTTTPSAIPSTIPIEVSGMPPETTDSSSIVSTSLLPSSSDDTDSTMRNSNSSSSTSNTPTSSVSMITISPPSSSQSALPSLVTYPKKEPNGAKISMYLIPVLVVVGAILGSLCAWIGWGCLTRKGRRGKTELEVGPAYDSEAGRVKADEGFSWPAMETQTQENTFLVLPTNPRRTRPLRPSRADTSSTRVSRKNTTTTMASVSVYSQVGEDEEYEEEKHDDDGMSFLDAYESDEEFMANARRPSSRAAGGGTQRVVSRRRNHVRTDSDMTVDGGRLGRSVTGKSTGGFRIIEESPLPTPAAVAKTPSGGLGGFFWGSQPETDKYTALPSRGQNSRSRSPVKPSRAGTTASHHPLPQSPRQIMSPRLEGSLCFTPSIGQEVSGTGGSEYDDALSLRKVEDIVEKSRSQKNLRIGAR
ncbi:uncharacterized protein EV420DRAFT_1645440 [Desarmillaria tabescens]|uniref:Mid2 domain-containing protein n=1 Tax=Armillaria tabescens TaxID=1929756 RepID=A0AA39K625_ARMTA|nr:uncharacterized protein EV420DRAFT_1645440 [Desarmillaria tabescens]KAK0452908.1 hypothetical protein EV420DRAFT_1645440 [Desarmillaria tabescens]